MATMEVEGEQAAILANYGVIPNPHGPRAAPMPEARPESPGDRRPRGGCVWCLGSDGQAAGRGGLVGPPGRAAGSADGVGGRGGLP